MSYNVSYTLVRLSVEVLEEKFFYIRSEWNVKFHKERVHGDKAKDIPCKERIITLYRNLFLIILSNNVME